MASTKALVGGWGRAEVVGGGMNVCSEAAAPPPPPLQPLEDVLEQLTAVGGAPPQTNVTIVGNNEIYNRENLNGPFLVHKHVRPRPPPPFSSSVLTHPWCPPRCMHLSSACEKARSDGRPFLFPPPPLFS